MKSFLRSISYFSILICLLTLHSIAAFAQPCPPIGFDVAGGNNINDTLYFSCNDAPVQLTAWDHATAGGYITPGFTMTVQTDQYSDYENTIFFYDGGNGTGNPLFHWSFTPSINGGTWQGTLAPNALFEAVQEYLNPTLVYSAQWCDYPPGGLPPDGQFPYTVIDNATGNILYSGVFDHNGTECFTLNLFDPPGGIANFTGAGVQNLGNGNGKGIFSPSVAGAGTHIITYNWDNTVGCSGSATQVVVVGSPIPTLSQDTLIFCQGDTPTSLASVVTGANLLWYDSPSGVGSPFPNVLDTNTPGTTTYYVSQTLNNCTESDWVPITVVVKPTPSNQFEFSANPACVGDLLTVTYQPDPALDPTLFTYQWFTPIAPITGSATINYPSATNANAGDYTLNVSYDGCDAPPLTQNLSVETNNPPIVAANVNICNSSSQGSVLNLFDLISSGDTNGVWTDIDNSGATGSATGLDFNGLAPGAYNFVYAITLCGIDYQLQTTVNVIACGCPDLTITPLAGSLCNQNGTLDLNTLLVTPEAGTWSVTAIPVGNNPADIDASGHIFDAIGATPGTYEIAFSLNNPPTLGCPTFSTQTLEVIAPPNAGTGGISVPVCNTVANALLNLSDFIAGEDLGGTWTATTGTPDAGSFDATAGTFNAFNHTAGSYTFTYTLDGSGSCPSAQSTVTILVGAPIFAGSNQQQLLCNNQNINLVLSDILTDELPGGLWSVATGSAVGGFDAATNSFNPNAQAVDTYTYNYIVSTNNGCPADTAQVSIEVIQPIGATVAANTTICNSADAGNNPILNFNTLITAGTVNGTWDDVDNSGSGGIFASRDFTGVAPGSYTFTYTISQAPCEPLVYTVEIVVQDCACPNVSTIALPVSLCNASNSFNLNNLLTANIEPGTWSISSTPAGSTNPSTITGTQFSLLGKDAGTYQVTYTLTTPPPVGCAASSTQNLTVVEQATAGVGGAYEICTNDADQLLLTDYITGEDAGGTWQLTPGSAVPIAGSFDTTAGTFELVGQTPGIYALTYVVTATPGCLSSPSPATITITLGQSPNAGLNGIYDVCNSNDEFVNLYNTIANEPAGGTWIVAPNSPQPDAGIFNAAAGTFYIANHTPGSYTFGYVVTAINNCPADTAFSTINVAAPISAGTGDVLVFCNDATDLVQLNDYLTNAPAGGNWVIANGSPQAGSFDAGNATFNVTGHPSGQFVFGYVVDGVGACPADTAEVFVAIPAVVIAGNSDTLSVCSSDAGNINLFSIITNEQAGGNWQLNPSSAVPTVGSFNAAGATFDATNQTTGTYMFDYVFLGSAQCANDTATATIILVQSPDAGIDGNIILCNDAPQTIDLSTVITNTPAGGTWSIEANPYPTAGSFDAANGTFNTAGQVPQTYTFTYTVAATNNACQAATSIALVNIEFCNCITPPTPVLVSSDQISICAGQTNTQAFEVSTAAGTNVGWYDAPTGGNLITTGTTFVPDTAGIYYARATHIPNDGCESEALTFVLQTVGTAANFSLSEQGVCIGTPVTATLIGDALPNAIYTWDFGTAGTATGSNPQTITWNAAQTDTITLSMEVDGCVSTSQQAVQVSGIAASFPQDTIFIVLGQKPMLPLNAASSLGGDLTFVWTPSETLSCPDCQKPTASPSQSTNYEVLISDEFGCQLSDNVFVQLSLPNRIVFPNAFSPNGDGTNDVFRAQGFNVQSISWVVYNRWGTKVYEANTTNLNEGWDGFLDGIEQEIGVYVYSAKVVYTDGKTEQTQANVTLVR